MDKDERHPPAPQLTRAEFESHQDFWASQEFLAAIVDSSDDAIIGKNLDGIIVTWNKGAERMYGFTAAEAVGQPLSMIEPPDRKGEIFGLLARIKNGEHVEHFESIRVAKDGRRLQVSISISPIKDPSGAIIGASAIARDMTSMERTREALQESQSTTQALFQSAAQGIVIADQTGRIVMSNPATEKLFGYSTDELVGKRIETLIPARAHAVHQQHRERYFAAPQSRPMGIGMDLQARRKDGSEFYVEISLSYIQSAHGTLGVAFVSDITRRRADEMALRKQQEDLRALAGRLMTAQDDERRRIARNLHDDLSQQLAHLAIDIGKLATKPSIQEFVPELRPLQLRAADAAETVRRISHELHPSILDDIGLEAAIEQYCEEFEERTGIPTEFSARDVGELPSPEVASSIYHIAQEALRNVAKHAETDSVLVTLQGDGGGIRLTVKDRGKGLVKEGRKSTGIGIAAMKERAHLIDGTFSIESDPGSGTEVRLEVPLNR